MSSGFHSGGGVPNTQRRTLRYYTSVALNPGAGATTEQVMSANSIFDPDETGVGHQSSTYDQLALWYQRYTVLRSKITLMALNSGAASEYVVPGLLVVSLCPTSSAPASAEQAIELTAKNKWTLMCARSDAGYVRLQLDFDAKKYFGVAKPQDNPEISAAFGASPVQEPCFIISYGATSAGGGDSVAITVGILVEYDVLVRQPKTLTQS